MNKQFPLEGFLWEVTVQRVKGHTPYDYQAVLKRQEGTNYVLWATIKRKHDGKFVKVLALPSYKISDGVWKHVLGAFDIATKEPVTNG